MAGISSNIQDGPYNADGVNTAFPFSFWIATDKEIAVEMDGQSVLSSFYHVTFNDDGGTVTFLTPPAQDAKILLRSNPDYRQASSFENEGSYNLATVNLINKRGVIRDLVLKGRVDRSLMVPVGELGGILPAAADRQGRVLGFGAGGTFIAVANDSAAVAVDVARAEVAAGIAEAAAVTLVAAADRAELAADAAALASGIAADEPTGRALVANGVVFAAVGATSDQSVDIWQRVGPATVSTLLRSYPSLAALNAALAALAAAVAASATKSDLAVTTSALESFAQEAAVSLAAAQASDLTADRMLDTATFIDTILGVDAVGKGTRPYKPVATVGYVYNPVSIPSDITLLLRAGQQHMITPRSDGSSYNFGNNTNRVNIASYGGEGAAACLDTRMPLAGQTWVAAGSSWTTTVTARNSLDFSSVPSVSGVHLMLWNVSAPHDDVLGSLFELKIGGATPAANDAAVDATSGVDAWSIKYVGQTAGDIRGTGHVGTSYVLRVKLADGSNPNAKPLFFSDCSSGISFIGGSNGHVLVTGTTGKDSISFWPTGSVSSGLIPWFESFTALGVGGHGGVGSRCTTGAFVAVGVPIPGEPTFAQGRAGGSGCHNFTPGLDLRNQYLYNGSIYTENFQTGCYGHGVGAAGEGYRGWNVSGDIEQVNCSTAIELQVTLVEGFKHAGRLILTGGRACVTSYPGQYFQLAGKGGLFKPANSQAALASFGAGGAREIVIGSDNPEELFILDGTLVNSGAPDYYSARLYTRSGSDSDPAPTLILKHVEDRTVTGPTTRGFLTPEAGFFPNEPYINLRLIGTKLQDQWVPFDNAPHWPKSLYVDGDSQIGYFGRTWAQIETAMAALGNPCTILTGAKAVNAAGVVVDVK